MKLKRKILKIFIYFLGLVCFFIYIYIRLNDKPLFLIDKGYLDEVNKGGYGDLYFLNSIEHFKLPIPEELPQFKLSKKCSSPEDADILIYGDSFFAGKARGKSLPEKLHDTLNKNIFFNDNYMCLLDLKNKNYSDKKNKILIYEIGEKYIFQVFSRKQKLENPKNPKFIEYRKYFPEEYEQKYIFLLRHSILTYRIYCEIESFKFNWLGCTPSATPAFLKNPPWLFDKMDVDGSSTSFYYKFSDTELKTLCDNIEDLNDKLMKQYNLKLVFLPIPNKYTIYHNLLNNDMYNNLIPAMCKELKSRNIAVIEVLDDFMNSDKLLYYPTDTHYNQDGDNIVLNKILEYFKDNSEK